MPNWKKVLVSGSTANLSSLSVDTSITASIISGSEITGSLFGTASQAVSSSYALTASYALSSPAGVGSSVIYAQDTPSTTWVFAHNLGGSYVTMNVYDGNNNIIIPQNITATGPNTLTLTFSIPTSGHAVATVGGGLPGISAIVSNYVLAVNQDGTAATWVSASGLSVTSASYATSASYSLTASYASASTSASYATNALTASYLSGYVSPFPFTGSAIISGSLTVTGSILQSGSFTSTGTITAQTLVVQTVSSSIIYSSGSNIFGNSLANTQALTGSVTITGSLTVNSSNVILSNQTSSMSVLSASYSSTSEWLGLNGNPISASSGIAAVTSTTVVASALTGSYYAAFFDYAAVSGSNSRAGTVMSTWNGALTVYNDVTTNDIGNTSQVTMSVDLSGASVRLKATTTSQWTIRSLVRLV